jgi:hypothetical protein
MTRSIVLLCALLLAGGRAAAQSADDFAGTWAFEVDGRNFAVLTLEAGPEGLQGTIQLAGVSTFAQAPLGIVISDVRGPGAASAVKEVRAESTGRVIVYDFPDGSSNESLLRVDGDDRLSLGLVAESPDFVTLTFTRAESSAVTAAGWDEAQRYYVRDPAPPPNAEIAAIFAADQADRQQLATIDWTVVGPRDAARRARVRQMLDDGLLRAADDYYFAAMVYQHGEAPEDYLLAHVFAMVAQAAGRPDAAWIAAATLDRFLRNVDRAQIFGTQYSVGPGGVLTQGNFDSELIPDSLRRALGVPTLEQQEEQRLRQEKQGQAR